ncbi:MAG: hypothetical protein ACE14L_00895 [Terriglobales bacterium]
MSLYLFILVVLAVVGWFAVGTQFNVRRGHKTLAWLQQGLKLLGDKSTLRWLGSSVVELKIQNAREPFRQVEVLIVLEPRDVALLWWIHHIRGRRDMLIIRAQLRSVPAFEFEALDPRGWSTRGIEQQLRFRDWDLVPLPETSPLVAYVAGKAPSASDLLALASPPQCPVARVAIRRTEPNLELHWNLADAQRAPAQLVLDRVCRLPERFAVHR